MNPKSDVSKLLKCLLGLALMFAVLPGARAQSVLTGGVAGVIADSTGARVPGATVILKSSETGTEYKTVTDSSGSYTISLVKPGHYTLTVQKEKFSKVSQTFDVGVGQVVSANYSLTVGAATETVEVKAEAPLLQTENANVATTYDVNQVEKLPNPGNDLTAIAQTAPGVLMNTSSGGGYGNFNAFGLPATANLFTVNGNDEMDPYLNLNNSGATNLLLGTNELQEVAVVSNGYTGQYGRQAGAQVDYVTKSGTNAFHGNAVYWWNGSAMNANDWFNNQTSTPRPRVNNNQWAASFGGPIKKDKAFFFVDTEGLRYVLASSNATIVPTTAFANAVLANLATVAPQSVPFYQNIFKLYANAPGINRAVPVDDAFDTSLGRGCGDFSGSLAGSVAFGPGATPCAQHFRSTVGQLSREWILASKFDYNISDKSRVAIRYRMDHGLQPTYTDPVSPIFNATSNQPEYEGQINYTSSFTPTIFNQFILSGSWYSAIFGNEATAAQNTFPGAFFDFDTSGWANIGGTNNAFPQGRKVTQYQLVDDVSWTRGTHTFKFGGNYRRNDISDYSNLVRTNARLRSFSMTDFTSGIIDQISQRFPTRDGNAVAIYSFGLYFQDEWRVTKNLKLTLALRGDRNSDEVCQSNCVARFVTNFSSLNHDPTVPFNQLFATGLHTAFPSIEKAVFQPRVGFAWQPKWAPNTVVRGGIGVFSDLYSADLIDNYMHNAPELNQFTFGGLPFFSGTGSAYDVEKNTNAKFLQAFAIGDNRAQFCLLLTAGLPCGRPDYNDIVGNVLDPKFVQYNLEIQHTFGSKTVLSANYVGNQGYDLFLSNAFANAFARNTPARTKAGLGPLPGLPTAALDQRVGNVSTISNSGESNYNGLTVSVTRRFTAGFSGRLNYSWSHALDDVSNGGLAPYSFNDSLLGVLNPNNSRLNYSNADYDIRHLVSANYVWDLPFKPTNTMLREIVGGWTLSGTLYHRTGLPFSFVDRGATAMLGNGVNTVMLVDPTTAVAASCTSALKACYDPSNFPGVALEPSFASRPRNSYRGPAYTGSDFSVAKNFRMTERSAFTAGVNFYNVFNHPNFANPVADISSGQFGTIQTTVVPPTSPYGSFVGSAVSGRLIQLMGKITF
jgi:outer membrane receptor protein involved in Fe transport